MPKSTCWYWLQHCYWLRNGWYAGLSHVLEFLFLCDFLMIPHHYLDYCVYYKIKYKCLFLKDVIPFIYFNIKILINSYIYTFHLIHSKKSPFYFQAARPYYIKNAKEECKSTIWKWKRHFPSWPLILSLKVKGRWINDSPHIVCNISQECQSNHKILEEIRQWLPSKK